jgi:RNA polymerase sigma factor (sigma-70 family)
MTTDADLIALTVAGDRDAFGQVVRRHQVPIFRYLARRTGRFDAEDLLAEVWINAFRSRVTYDLEQPTALPWLYAIARNVVRGHWRQIDRHSDSSADVFDPWHEVDNRLVANAAARGLRKALMSLPDEQREVLLLVAWEELSPSEAALVLGIPAGTARSHLHRSRQMLRERAAVLVDPNN